jgi:hypothetical protein
VEAKLKELLIEKIKLSQKELADDPGLKVKLEKPGQKTSLSVDKKCPPNALLVLVERKVRKQRIWKAAKYELVRIALSAFVADILRKQAVDASKVELSAARERQLALFPGFESLPTRIRSGNTFLKFPETSVPQFLTYADKYLQRSQRDQKTADELRKLAEMVRPYAELEMSMEKAFERAQIEQRPAGLAVVK